jgi:hypothetical protein
MQLTPITAPITETGQYIIRWKDGSFELITVFHKPERTAYGVRWKADFFIQEWGGKCVDRVENNSNIVSIAKIHD